MNYRLRNILEEKQFLHAHTHAHIHKQYIYTIYLITTEVRKVVSLILSTIIRKSTMYESFHKTTLLCSYRYNIKNIFAKNTKCEFVKWSVVLNHNYVD